MISKDKQYRTRDGRQVRIYAIDGDGCFPIHGAVAMSGEADRWVARCWRADGSATISGPGKSDLFEAKPRHKRTVWLNVFEDNIGVGAFTIKDAADSFNTHRRIACLRLDLDFEEGEGL